MPIRYSELSSELLRILWGLHPSRIKLVVIYPGHVLDVPGKLKECNHTRDLAGFCVIYAVMNVIAGFGNER